PTEPAAAVNVGGSALELILRAFGNIDLEADLDFAPEAKSQPSLVFDVDDDLVPALPLTGLEPGLLEQRAHFFDVAAGIELDPGRRPVRYGLELDAALRDPPVGGDLPRGVEGPAPHGRRA